MFIDSDFMGSVQAGINRNVKYLSTRGDEQPRKSNSCRRLGETCPSLHEVYTLVHYIVASGI
jgi:hypothetical protein